MNDTTSQLTSQQLGYKTGILYHVTTRYRADLIAARGIDPARSKGKRKVSWFVDHSKVDWTIAHVSLRHKCPVENIVVIPVTVGVRLFKNSQFRDVYTCGEIVYTRPNWYMSARRWLKYSLTNVLPADK
jgi:hypothetical protein